MQGYKKEFITLTCVSHAGPLALVDGSPSAEDLFMAARITARYGQGRDAEQVDVSITDNEGCERIIQVKPFGANEIPEQWFI